MNPALYLLFYIGYPVLGYQLLKLKGYTGWWNLMLIISYTPLFWLIGAIVKNRVKGTNTTTISAIAGVFGIINLWLIQYLLSNR